MKKKYYKFFLFFSFFLFFYTKSYGFLDDLFFYEGVTQESLEQKTEAKERFFVWRVGVISVFYGFVDADFLKYSHSQYHFNRYNGVENSDDASYFILSSAILEGAFSYGQSFLKIYAYQTGLWGSDFLEGKDPEKNNLLLKELYFSYTPFSYLSFSLGRQRFFVGDSLKEYFFDDTIDGLKIFWGYKKKYSLLFLADLVGTHSSPNGYLYSFLGSQKTSFEDFQGDTLSFRLGLVLNSAFLKSFHFFLRYGANAYGGADRAENGKNNLNQGDGDFLTLNGIRFFYFFQNLGQIDFTLTHSYGKDYLYQGERVYHGIAGVFNWQKKFFTNLEVFLSAGYFSPHFLNFKGRSMGGSLLYGVLGYFPSSYAGPQSFLDRESTPPLRPDRTCSKTFFKLESTWDTFFGSFFLKGLVLWQTHASSLEFMGNELELGALFSFSFIKVRLAASAFFPSSYYPNLSQIAAEISHGKDTAYGFSLSASCFFDSLMQK